MLYRSAVIGLLYFLCVSTFSCKKSSLNSSEVDLIRKQLDEDLTTMLWAWSGGGQRSDLPNKYRKEVLQLNPLKPEISGAFDKAIQVEYRRHLPLIANVYIFQALAQVKTFGQAYPIDTAHPYAVTLQKLAGANFKKYEQGKYVLTYDAISEISSQINNFGAEETLLQNLRMYQNAMKQRVLLSEFSKYCDENEDAKICQTQDLAKFCLKLPEICRDL